MYNFLGWDFVALTPIAVTDTKHCTLGSFGEHTFQHSEAPFMIRHQHRQH